jgi:hypothetical protein
MVFNNVIEMIGMTIDGQPTRSGWCSRPASQGAELAGPDLIVAETRGNPLS